MSLLKERYLQKRIPSLLAALSHGQVAYIIFSMLIRDLISLPEIKTVVQLRDTENEGESVRLVDHFILTDEVALGLRIILQHICSGSGAGFFLKGHFGSGKSHFLAYLSLILSRPELLQRFLSDYQKKEITQSISLQPLTSVRVAVLPLSLVDYRSCLYLEDILSGRIREIYPEFFSSPEMDEPSSRKDFMDRLFHNLETRGYQGLLLVIDELSEFLRSKPSFNDFNEDVRYLQFLGEASSHRPLWIVGAVQEFIEETGEIHQEVFNKIKDRYPNRILLSAAHLKSLVRDLLIQKKAEARPVIEGFYRKLRDAFPDWQTGILEFSELYPVHPAAIDLLEDLKPLFSKTRGFVDFIHYQVKGDSDRGIPGMMDRPAESLLCPDSIFDHFLDRMKSTLHILPYVETVYAFYNKEVSSIFDEEADREFALRLLKLLILQEISPLNRHFNGRELTEMLLERVTDIEPQLNYRYTVEIAAQLARKGGYLRLEDGARPPAQQTFSIQLEEGVQAVIGRKIEYRRALLNAVGGQVVPQLFSHIANRLPFFQGLGGDAPEPLLLNWQNTSRLGRLIFCPGHSGDLHALESETPEESVFTLTVLPPRADSQRGPVEHVAPDMLKAQAAGLAALLVPAPLSELERCQAALALFEVGREYKEDQSRQGRRILDEIESQLEEKLDLLGPLFERSYRSASLITREGTIIHEFENSAARDCRQLLEEAGSRLLDERFPKHDLIAPRQNYYPPSALREVSDFFLDISSASFEHLRWGRTVLEGFLLPTGIIQRRRKEYSFCTSVDQCAPLQQLVERTRQLGRCSARQAFETLSTSEFGMSEPQFQAFLLAALHGGFLEARRSGRRIPLGQLEPDDLLQLSELKPGETVSVQTADFLSRLTFLPARLRKGALSFSESRQCWDLIVEQHRTRSEQLQQLEGLLARYRDYQAFQLLQNEELGQAVETVQKFLKNVRISRPPVQGLEELATEGAPAEDLQPALDAFDNAVVFFREGFSAFSFMSNYLVSAGKALPDSEEYRELRIQLEELFGRFRNWNPCDGSDSFDKLRKDFQCWQQIYIPRYQKDHRDYYGSNQFEAVQSVLKGEEFQLLERLETLAVLIPTQSSREIRRQAGEQVQPPCHRSVWEELQQRPICSCGFLPGQLPQAVNSKKVELAVQSQLDRFANQLQHPRLQEFLERFEFQLRQAGKAEETAARGLEALKKAQGFADLVAAQAALSSSLLQRLAEFEPGEKPFQILYLDAFQQGLGGIPHSPQHLIEEFRKWLTQGRAGRDVPVLLMDRAAGDEPDETFAADVISGDFPELLAEWQRLTQEEFFWRLFSALLVKQYKLDIAKARGQLTLLPPDDLLESYSRLGTQLIEKGVSASSFLRLRSDFEKSLGETAWEKLGILESRADHLAELIVSDSFFEVPVRLAVRTLLKKMPHLSARDLNTLENLFCGAASSGERSGGWNFRPLLQVLIEVFKALATPSESPETPRAQLEKRYREFLALLPLQIDRVRNLLRETDMIEWFDIEGLSKLVAERRAQFQSTFVGCLGEAEKLPRVAERVRFMAQKERQRGSSGIFFLFTDALSWPLWQSIREELQKKVPPRVVIRREDVAYAHLPTNTRDQLREWLERENLKPETRLSKGSAPSDLREGHIYTLDWIDEKVHTSREGWQLLFEEIRLQLVPQLASFTGKLPPGSSLILFSDHGFTENAQFDPAQKYRHSRYRHGGNSPWEVLVPIVTFSVT